jgi:hypothetical protein
MRIPQPKRLPACRRIRITLRPDEWQILSAVAQKYRKPVSWVLGVAARAFLEPAFRATSTAGPPPSATSSPLKLP